MAYWCPGLLGSVLNPSIPSHLVNPWMYLPTSHFMSVLCPISTPGLHSLYPPRSPLLASSDLHMCRVHPLHGQRIGTHVTCLIIIVPSFPARRKRLLPQVLQHLSKIPVWAALYYHSLRTCHIFHLGTKCFIQLHFSDSPVQNSIQ